MLMLCGSSAAPRYVYNIMQILALPPGLSVQYRYTVNLLDDETRALAKQRKLKGMRGVVAYLHLLPAGSRKTIVPCREVTIEAVEEVGEVLTLQLRADRYVHVENLTSFNSSVRELDASKVQSEIDEKDRRVVCIEEQTSIFEMSKSLGTWQETVKDILALPSFGTTGIDTFFVVKGVGQYEKGKETGAQGGRNILPTKGAIAIQPDEDHVISVHHFRTKSQYGLSHGFRFDRLVFTAGDGVRFTTHNEHAIDSNYDVFNLVFRCQANVRPYDSFVLLKVNDPEGNTKAEISIPVSVSVSLLKLGGQVAVIGFFVALPAVIIQQEFDVLRSAFAFGAGCIAGLASMFGYRRAI